MAATRKKTKGKMARRKMALRKTALRKALTSKTALKMKPAGKSATEG